MVFARGRSRTAVGAVPALAAALTALVACHGQTLSPAARDALAPLRGAQITTLVLDAAKSPQFRFDQVTLLAPARGYAIESAAPMSAAEAVARIEHQKARRVLFFLAGFDTSFAHGAVDGARVAQVVDPQTFVIYADWGSRGKALAYRRDAKAAARNAPAFGHALEFLHRALPKEELDIFAHSMGGRVAVRGLAATAREHRRVTVRHLVLAAPDVQISDYLAMMQQVASVGRATIYVSRRDKALLLSAAMHLHHRLGQVNAERWDFPRTDIVDVSAEDHSKDGHGYAIHDLRILMDIYQVVAGAPLPHRRWCRSSKYSAVWVYTMGRLPTCQH